MVEDMNINLGGDMLAESKFFSGYSRWIGDEGRYEGWEKDQIPRVMNMHREKYAEFMTPELEQLFKEAEEAYKAKEVLGAQRALQFGGEQLFKHEARMYNCSVSYADRTNFFSECMYLLLCGCGVGFSVQSHHINKLPQVARRSKKKVKIFQVPDSIEGWADAFDVLLSSYFVEGGKHPEYRGCIVHFDFSKIRPRGSKISGGFKAPGPDGLRAALIKCEDLLEDLLQVSPITSMKSIVAYDFVMHMSDAVLSGGVRRSATICIFDKWDQDMLTAKTGNWFEKNPQRGRSNNSAMIIREQLAREEWAQIMQSVKQFGEPGFIFSDSNEYMFNPCVEIGMVPKFQENIKTEWESGFQFCNLTEINGKKANSPEIFFKQCRAAAILGTLQAGYTNFKYVTEATRKITEREALIGVSITGWVNNPDVLFNESILQEGARIVMEVNELVASMININPAARGTCVKPSGNASVLLQSGSGIHGEHAPRYFRNVQMNNEDQVAQLIKRVNPKMVETSVWNANGTDMIVQFPIETKPGSLMKSDLLGVKQLELVKTAQINWVNAGTRIERCVDPGIRHNVSNTISVDNWDEIEQYIYDNMSYFAGISLLSSSGDKDYAQAPFTEVLTFDKMASEYGPGSLFASGLIVDALHAFNNDLWLACSVVLGHSDYSEDDSTSLLKRDWVRRANKFAENYFGNDLKKMTYCLKDCHNIHKWETITREFTQIDFNSELIAQTYIDVDSIGSQACSGGACEITF